MSVQDDKAAGQHNDQDSDQDNDQDSGQQLTEKPEPDEGQKEKAAEMMTAYEDRPTLVLPGTGGKVSGTAVNDWLDEDGNPKQTEVIDRGADDTGSDDGGSNDQGKDEKAHKEQVEKDKAWKPRRTRAKRAELIDPLGTLNA
jgi:hypothetical protein